MPDSITPEDRQMLLDSFALALDDAIASGNLTVSKNTGAVTPLANGVQVEQEIVIRWTRWVPPTDKAFDLYEMLLPYWYRRSRV